MKYIRALLGLAMLTTTTFPASASDTDQIGLIPASALRWVETPEGVAFAALFGDRATGPYQAMVRLPSGTISPPHVKSANMFGVMIEGEMIHYPHGGDAANSQHVGPGAFYMIPKNVAHISACVSDSPCVAYLYQDGPFDFVPVSQ